MARVEVRSHSINLMARYKATGMQVLGLLVINTLSVEAHTNNTYSMNDTAIDKYIKL